MPGISTPSKAECQTKRKHRDEEGGPQAAGAEAGWALSSLCSTSSGGEGLGAPRGGSEWGGPRAALTFTGESLLQACVRAV